MFGKKASDSPGNPIFGGAPSASSRSAPAGGTSAGNAGFGFESKFAFRGAPSASSSSAPAGGTSAGNAGFGFARKQSSPTGSDPSASPFESKFAFGGPPSASSSSAPAGGTSAGNAGFGFTRKQSSPTGSDPSGNPFGNKFDFGGAPPASSSGAPAGGVLGGDAGLSFARPSSIRSGGFGTGTNTGTTLLSLMPAFPSAPTQSAFNIAKEHVVFGDATLLASMTGFSLDRAASDARMAGVHLGTYGCCATQERIDKFSILCEAKKNTHSIQFVYHGTDSGNLASICEHGLRVPKRREDVVNGEVFGRGIYGAFNLTMSMTYCRPRTSSSVPFGTAAAAASSPSANKSMLLCAVLINDDKSDDTVKVHDALGSKIVVVSDSEYIIPLYLLNLSTTRTGQPAQEVSHTTGTVGTH